MKNLTALNDQQLIKLYIDGNNEAFSVITMRHKDRIFTAINLLVKDKYLAEDIFQDVFIKIIDSLKKGKYNEDGKFIHWAMRVAHNMTIDHFRSKKRNLQIITGNDDDFFEDFNFAEPGIDQKISKAESANTVKKMLDLLPEDQREVVILRHFANLSFKEIADLTNCSINTSLGRMRYGLSNLKKMKSLQQLAL